MSESVPDLKEGLRTVGIRGDEWAALAVAVAWEGGAR